LLNTIAILADLFRGPRTVVHTPAMIGWALVIQSGFLAWSLWLLFE
jgi:hypothetical protein